MTTPRVQPPGTDRDPLWGTCSVLLLDLGGTVLRSPMELFSGFTAQFPAAAEPARRAGPFGMVPDLQWRAVRRGDLSEQGYWSSRAREFGAVLGHPRWTARDLFAALFATCADPRRPAAMQLIEQARTAGIPVAALTNDLRAFHGEPPGPGSPMVTGLQTIVDGSVTGVRKPDPRAYAAAVEALQVAAAEVVFVDDLPGNVAGARAFGMVGVELDLLHPGAAFDRARIALGLPAPDMSAPDPDGPLLADGWLRGGPLWPPSWAPIPASSPRPAPQRGAARSTDEPITSGGTR